MGVVDKVCMFHPAVQKNKRTIHSKSTHPLNWTGSQEYDYVMQTWKIDWTMWKAKGFTQVPNTVVMGSEPVDLGTGIKTGYRVPHLCPRPWEDPQAALEGSELAPGGAAHSAGWTRGDVVAVVLPTAILTCIVAAARHRAGPGRGNPRHRAARALSMHKPGTTPLRECKTPSPTVLVQRVATEEDYRP